MGSVILGDMRSYIKKTGGASSFRHQEPPGDIGTLVNTLQLQSVSFASRQYPEAVISILHRQAVCCSFSRYHSTVGGILKCCRYPATSDALQLQSISCMQLQSMSCSFSGCPAAVVKVQQLQSISCSCSQKLWLMTCSLSRSPAAVILSIS